MSLNTSQPVRLAVALLLALAVLAILATPVGAAPAAAGLHAMVLPAWDMQDIVHDRSRLIQFSIVAVAFGIALLWWGQKW